MVRNSRIVALKSHVRINDSPNHESRAVSQSGVYMLDLSELFIVTRTYFYHTSMIWNAVTIKVGTDGLEPR